MSARKVAMPKLWHVGREVLETINGLPETYARRVVKFLALVYLRPRELREIIAILEKE